MYTEFFILFSFLEEKETTYVIKFVIPELQLNQYQAKLTLMH